MDFRIPAAIVAVAIAFPALAQTETAKRRDNREENQEHRIKQGEKAGKISSQEAARLRKGQDRVRDLENKAEYDGKVTKEERARIEKAQDRQSRKIARERNDANAAAGGSR
jgi:hypothetical protein